MKKLVLCIVLLFGCAAAITVKAQATAATPAKKAVVVPVKAKVAPTVARPVAEPVAAVTPAPAVPAKKQYEDWDFFQLAFWFGIPSSTQDSNVYGIKVGAPFSAGTGCVYGVETAVFCGATDNIKGVQACILTSISKKLSGFQGGIVNFCDEVTGLQFGIVNVAKSKSFQFGIVNVIEDGAIPCLPVINYKF